MLCSTVNDNQSDFFEMICAYFSNNSLVSVFSFVVWLLFGDVQDTISKIAKISNLNMNIVLILYTPTLLAFRHPLSDTNLLKLFLKNMEKYWKYTGIFINI